MAKKDSSSNIVHKIAFHIRNITSTTSVNGEVIDTKGFESILFTMQRGESGGGTATIQIRESNFNGEGNDPPFLGSSTVVDANDLVGLTADTALAECESSSRIGYVGKKRYVLLEILFIATNDMDIGGMAILGDAFSNPTLNEIDILPEE